MTVLKLFLSLAAIAILLTLAPISKGQQPGGTTSVVGVVKDPQGNLYTNSQISFIFYDPGTSGKLPLLNGSTFQTTFTGYGTDSFGAIPAGIYLPDNGLIAGSSGATGTQWIVKVCYSDRITCFTTNLTINCAGNQPSTCTSGIIDLTSTLQAVAALLPLVPGAPGGITGSVQCNNLNHFVPCGQAFDTGGVFTISNLNNVVAVDGHNYTTLTAAFADPKCAAQTGCTIDMRGINTGAALTLGSFDPVNTPVTLLLGPYTYTTSGITLRPNFHLIGVAGGGPTSTSTGTNLTPINTSSPIIKMPSSATTGIADVLLSNFRIICAAGNSNQVAINITAPANSGLWYSTMNNILIQGCAGEGLLFSSAGYPAINQWLEFRSIFVNRQSSGLPALHIVGPAGQFIFTNCQFDSIAQIGGTHDNLPNIVVEDIATPFVATYNIAMYQTTSQGGGVAIKLRGTQNFTCDNCHFEHDYGILDAAQGNNYGNYGVSITNAAIYTSAVNAGAGYLITMDANSEINFENAGIYAPTPIDNFYLGNLTNLSVRGVFNQANGQPFPNGQSSTRLAQGIFSDSSGLKFVTQSTGSIPSNSRISVAVNWTTPFPDAGYAPFCFVGDFNVGATTQGVTVERQSGSVQTSSGFSVTVFNPTGAAQTSNLYCLAIRSNP